VKPTNSPKVESFEAAEQARKVHEDCIRELQKLVTDLQKLPAAGLRIIESVELEDGVDRVINHKLGRKATFVQVSAVRGALNAGRVEEVRGAAYNRDQVVVLNATGYGATITVDVVVA
jgi:hypothetical protein